MTNSHSLLCLVVFVLLSICIWDALHLEITKPPLGGSDQSWLAALFGRAAICQFAAESLHFPTWWHMIMIIQRREASFFFKWPDPFGDGKCLMGINIEKLRLSTFSIGARSYHLCIHKLFNENWGQDVDPTSFPQYPVVKFGFLRKPDLDLVDSLTWHGWQLTSGQGSNDIYLYLSL